MFLNVLRFKFHSYKIFNFDVNKIISIKTFKRPIVHISINSNLRNSQNSSTIIDFLFFAIFFFSIFDLKI